MPNFPFPAWPANASRPIQLEPIGVPLEMASVLTGISRPRLLAAAVNGAAPVYRDDSGALIVAYSDLPKFMAWLPKWQPRRRTARSTEDHGNEGAAA
jgi:hypothetical protein